MISRYSCVETRAIPGSSHVVILIVVILLSFIKYHDKVLILPEFSFMKTVREDEITHCIIRGTMPSFKLRISSGCFRYGSVRFVSVMFLSIV